QPVANLPLNRHKMIPSPGLAGWSNRSELLHQAVERLVGAPQIAGKLDHSTSLEVDAVTTQDCSADWHYLTLKVKILSDEVNKTQSQLLLHCSNTYGG